MTPISRGGVAALLVSHCAGMLDLVALPVWVGALIAWFHLDPQQAGLLVSLFLAGQVVSSVVLAPRFARIPARLAALVGFTLAGLSFLGVSRTDSYTLMALLHFTGGLGAGCALSVTHGTIGRSRNPHRLFALAGFAIALFGIFILGGGSKLVELKGGTALFVLFGGIMIVAAVVAAIAFPRQQSGVMQRGLPDEPLSSRVWFGMVGMGLMALAQSTMFSFVERLGADRGYGAATVTGVLIAAGILNIVPGPLAGWLQHKLRAERVIVVGPLLHALAVFALTQTQLFPVYAVVVSLLIAVTVFTHTFLFGLLAHLDPTGRAVAATPAMLMIGSAVGPFLGGTAVKLAGYPALGLVVCAIGILSALVFSRVRVRTCASAAGTTASTPTP